MDQIQVDVVQPHALHALLDGDAGLVVMVVTAGQLRSDDDLLARHLGFADCAADGALVLIVERAVDKPVADFERRFNGLDALASFDLIGAEADGRQFQAVVGGARGNLRWVEQCHGVSLCESWRLALIDCAVWLRAAWLCRYNSGQLPLY